MPFTPKSWVNSPSTTTPLSAAALIDLEARLAAYTDAGNGPLQNGIFQTGDLLVGTVSINTSTCALTFTPASTGLLSPLVASASGVLVATAYSAGAQTITPATPTSTNYAVIGVEIDTTGAITLVKGTTTATQLNTGTLIAANTPATSSGKMRIADFGVWNNAGTYNFGDHTTVATQGVNWIDRRPWARGALARTLGGTGSYSTVSASTVAMDTTLLSARIECTGAPVQITFQASGILLTAAGNTGLTTCLLDGSAVDGYTSINICGNTLLQWAGYTYVVAAMAAGSHLFQAAFSSPGGASYTVASSAGRPISLVVQELVRQNVSTNGIA